MNYEKYFCPVCNQDFKDGDDVVVCPECGTAHHRACWNDLGKCFNDEKHGSNENLKDNFLNEYENEEASDVKSESVPVEVEIQEESKNFHQEFDQNPAQSYLIEGREAVYYQIAVRKNQKYYIPTFMAISQTKGKAISWNIAGFFVPLAWSLYRKMYRITALVLSLYVLIFGISAYYVLQNDTYFELAKICLEEDPEFIDNIILSQQGRDVLLTKNQQNLLNEMNKMQMPQGVSTFCTILLYASKFFIALKSNKLYMNKIGNEIDKAKQIGLNKEMIKHQIFKKCGTLPFAFAFIIGFLEWTIFR